ncbi:uncharacterized protein K489DRAFT_414269 [Dissoconium aciculare CBS 342.82]|jgi:hypothetical protein|uniref:Uncharacterized protein n=1 Tax=Dissoconium aciculare CBS 342.82 TaxID=1314786 RepID=A0A6J3LRD0_9PEZI|nr:uncharacterized protein K489DRAFT_414269 [Dissoconium aciculare CBS 342.82]KAF1817834.1 hypothetical protein K489DRAFT_414269 [Dissoconium aciculare CBS 342.82]
MLKNGFWNAGQLLQEASKQAEARSSHYDLAADYWMGEDWTDYEKRIKDNIGRASNFVNNGKTSNYITVTCKDPKNYCKKDPIDGKQIGGYAWDYNGWTGKYGHITMCDPYFTLGTFAETVDKINNWKKTGENSKLYQMENYQTTGQFIVHEMMHLHSTYDPEPLITDIKLRVVGKAPPYAYGPYNVRRLAAGPKFPTKGDYGAALSTINSDSYTMLINSAFWWEIVGRLPGVSPEDSGVAPPNSPLLVFPRVSVANTSDFSIASVDSLLAQEIDLYFQKEDAPTPNDTPTPTPAPSDVPTQDQNACHGIGGDYWVRSRDVAAQNVVDFCGQTELEKIYNANSVNELKLSVRKLHGDSQTPRDAPDCVGRFTNAVIDGCDGADSLNNPHNYKFGSTLTTADGWEYKMTPLSQQVNQVSCDAQYKFFFDSFEIRGKNLPDALFGAEGEGLKKQIEGCGALTFWNFERTPDDCCFQWYAAGNLPIGTQACIGRALMSAGGSSIGRCWGIGKRQGEQNHQVNNKRQVNTTRQVDSIDSWPGYGDEGRHVFRNPPLIGRDNIDAWPGYGDEGKHVFKNATRQ